jgi:hypothetical protein
MAELEETGSSMKRSAVQVAGGGMTTGVMLAGAVALLALPSAVLAFSTRFDSGAAQRLEGSAPKDPAVRAQPAQAISLRSLARGPLFPFTPAGTANRPSRSVTVAVRVDPATARDILVHAPRLARAEGPADVPVRIAPTAFTPTAFTLGVSRGFGTFSQDLAAAERQRGESGDALSFQIPGPSSTLPRLSPRVVLDSNRPAGRAPRTFADTEKKVDLGGSYRLTRNLNVTAGVRYEQERERLRPITDGNPDNQAVYVGTQFRF